MRGARFRSAAKSGIAILSTICFLVMSLGVVSRAVAADAWETWPAKKSEPGVDPKPSAEAGGPAGDAKEKKTNKGRSYGTFVWIALGIAAVVGIAIAAGGSGGGDGGGTVTNPGHR
jgi:hypothetical protein